MRDRYNERQVWKNHTGRQKIGGDVVDDRTMEKQEHWDTDTER